MQSSKTALALEESLRWEESKRRKREGWVILATALMVIALIWFEVQLPEVAPEYALGSNIVFFLLINVIIILLVLLVFLVIRNLVKMIVERRQRILGSRLQVRLVLAFVALSLVPSVLLFAIAGGFLTRSFDRWFDSQVETALQGALEIGQTYYQNSANNALYYGRQLGQKITDEGLLNRKKKAELNQYLKIKQREYNLGTIEVFDAERRPVVVAVNDQIASRGSQDADAEFLSRALRGLEGTRTQPFGEGDVIRGGVPLFSEDKRIVGVIVVDYFVPKSITKRALQISRSYDQYKYLTFLKTPVKNSYILTLLLITLVIIFAATWCGIYLSKGITIPIQKLAEGTHEVAQGNWDYKIDSGRDDELGVLMNSFNHMTGDLKQIKSEMERRGKIVETLLANIAAGVISVDSSGKITTWNKAAERILGVSAVGAVGRTVADVFQAAALRDLQAIIGDVGESGTVEREIQLAAPDRVVTALVTAATLHDEDGSSLGVMVFIEDITQIQKVQRMEAWREVARRIAHEIKNPLTPIKLSAERLRKRYTALLESGDGVLDKCTTTIVQQVDELKNLVNEFSQFARLPSVRMAPCDLNAIVNEALFLFQEGHDGIRFVFRPGAIPTLELDREQIKRVLINLLDNAVAAVTGGGEIGLSTAYDRDRSVVILEVSDNGVGVPAELRAKIFEPYFSTKDNGTGLGLTIVSQIVEDHHAYIRAFANEPYGTRVTIEFPVTERKQTVELTQEVLRS